MSAAVSQQHGRAFNPLSPDGAYALDLTNPKVRKD